MAETGSDMGETQLHPSVGWGVVHLLLRVDPGAAGDELLDAIAAFTADEPNQVLTFSVLGGGADLGVMALSPDVDRLDALTKVFTAQAAEVVYSFFSLTEGSEYTTTEDDERARLQREGVDDVEEALATWRTRMDHYLDSRLHPRLPKRRIIGFYPMSKRRAEGGNWYLLPFEDRKRLMGGHAKVGRRYSGRILQLITGATGLDDWEWGVTLLADDPVAVKEIVYEMRFDEVTARYGEFGPFWTGLLMEPAAALERVGLTLGG